MKSVAVVLGTFNRLPLLQRAVASIRASVGVHPYVIVVVDGGSTDGTEIWLAAQRDVHLIRQQGPLTGAVAAFNLGFGYAVDAGFDYVMHLNDDAEIIAAWPCEDLARAPIAAAIALMEAEPSVGEVAFEHDLRGGFGFEYVNGVPYANFGVVRREAGMAVAQVQGDPTGRAWWNPIYRTYGADTEFGCHLWIQGYRVLEAYGLRVADMNRQDELRDLNNANGKHGDSDLFWSRWRDVTMPTPPPVPKSLASVMTKNALGVTATNPEYEQGRPTHGRRGYKL